MSAPFQPGDVVVCVDDRGPRNEPTERPTGWIVRGNHYRVEECIDHALGAGVKISGVVVNRFDWFFADRFRKIDDEVTEDFRAQLRGLRTPAHTLPPEAGDTLRRPPQAPSCVAGAGFSGGGR